MKTFELDTEASVFEKIWPGGYIEVFNGYHCGTTEQDIANAGLIPFYLKTGTALELGCGRGYWTEKYLLPNFKKVIALDVIEQKFCDPCLQYIQVPSKSFSCPNVPDGSVDFLFSFGLFCHLSHAAQVEYLKNAFHKLRRGGQAVVAFANYKRHPNAKDLSDEALLKFKETNVDPEGGAWFYSDLETQKEAARNAGFVDFADLIPTFRDTLAYFRKP